jgi:hypothetical protein
MAIYYVLRLAAAGREMCRGEEAEVVVAMAMAEGRERPVADWQWVKKGRKSQDSRECVW